MATKYSWPGCSPPKVPELLFTIKTCSGDKQNAVEWESRTREPHEPHKFHKPGAS